MSGVWFTALLRNFTIQYTLPCWHISVFSERYIKCFGTNSHPQCFRSNQCDYQGPVWLDQNQIRILDRNHITARLQTSQYHFFCIIVLKYWVQKKREMISDYLQIINICLFVAGIWVIYTERRKHIDTFFTSLALAAGNPSFPMDSHQKEPVMQQFCFFDVSLEKHSNKQSIGRWNEKPKRSCDITHNTE